MRSVGRNTEATPQLIACLPMIARTRLNSCCRNNLSRDSLMCPVSEFSKGRLPTTYPRPAIVTAGFTFHTQSPDKLKCQLPPGPGIRLVKTAPNSSSPWKVTLPEFNVPIPETSKGAAPTALASIGKLITTSAMASAVTTVILSRVIITFGNPSTISAIHAIALFSITVALAWFRFVPIRLKTILLMPTSVRFRRLLDIRASSANVGLLQSNGQPVTWQ